MDKKAPPTHITNWEEIEKLAIAGLSDRELAERFPEVKEATIRKRRLRHKWMTPLAIARRAEEIAAKGSSGKDLVQIAAEDWNSRGEAHRKTAFDIANASIKKFKPKAPKNFRELKAADDIARRAAGLDISEVNQQTLIMMHERVNAFGGEQEEPEEIGQLVIEAELIEPTPAAQLPDTESESAAGSSSNTPD